MDKIGAHFKELVHAMVVQLAYRAIALNVNAVYYFDNNTRGPDDS